MRWAARRISGDAVRRDLGTLISASASLDGYDVDWPVTHEEISPFYTRVEKMIGVASTVQNRPSNPDGIVLAAVQVPLSRPDSGSGV